jgi:stearoyl-CoA desaturase (delta-9 desaturase)
VSPYGLFDLSLGGYIVATLILTHITIAAVTIFLHRSQSHRALELHPVVAHFFRFWLWLTTGMVTRQWVAVHRKHHARCETAEDPHSPWVFGIRKVLMEGAELYKDAAADRDLVQKFGHGTPDDWIERHLYSRFSALGIVLMLVIDLVLFGLPGITVWAVQMLWIPFFAAGVINGLGHWWGYRNYEVEDASTNIVPWGILIGGEELHNNHHSFASSAKLSSRPWEFDIGWLYIRVLEALGLARVKRVPPRPVMMPEKTRVDGDTLAAVIANRLQVMARYAREVVGAVYREELRKAHGAYREMLRRARRLLIREESLLSEESRLRLETVLQTSKALETVYRYRQRLQAIWKQRTASQESLLAALQEWCQQAEATGIRALQDFAHTLRSYSMPPPARA